jgi:hypothetical protein
LLTFFQKAVSYKRIIFMMFVATSNSAITASPQAKINLSSLIVGEPLISLFEQVENSYIVFASSPSFKREEGWHST